MPKTGETYNPHRKFIGSLIPNEILRCEKLSSNAKLAFGRLAQYAGENGKAFPSHASLGAELGLGRRQAFRVIKELQEFGLIRAVNRKRNDGGITSNSYLFVWHPIFSDNPSDKNDTTPSDKNDTTPCQIRQGVVSSETHKENNTKDNGINKTTIERALLLLVNTPFETLSCKELEAFGRHYGCDMLLKAADVAAESWRRDRKEILNPGGYLRTLCSKLVIPEWHQSPEVRDELLQKADNRKAALQDQQKQDKARAEEVERERKEIWSNLSKGNKEFYLSAAKKSVSKNLGELKLETIISIAQKLAHDDQLEMESLAADYSDSLPEEYYESASADCFESLPKET